MLFLIYLFPIAAWLAFVYFMHHSGGRPTTEHWWAVMTALGTFELSKGIFALFPVLPSVTMAFGAAVLMHGLVMTYYVRQSWESAEEMPAHSAVAASH